MSDNGVPIIGQHKIDTAFRKLHLEPNDFIIVTDPELLPEDIMAALQGYSCAHSELECKGHRVIFAPGGIESLSPEVMMDMIAKQSEGEVQ